LTLVVYRVSDFSTARAPDGALLVPDSMDRAIALGAGQRRPDAPLLGYS